MLLTRTASSQAHHGYRRRTPLRARLWAAFLVLLIALPFTAPFSTCDLATLLAAPAPHATGHSVGSAQIDATAIAPVVPIDEEKSCDLEAPQARVELVTVAAAASEIVRSVMVCRTTPSPLRL